MKVLLVRTARPKQAITLGELMFAEPIGLECVGGVIKEWYEVEILDLMAEAVPLKQVLIERKPDVVGITSLCVDVHSVLDCAREVKKTLPSAQVLVGGSQAVLSPQSFFHEGVDHVFACTNRENLLALLSAIETGVDVPELPGIASRARGYRMTGPRGINACLVPDRSLTSKWRHTYSYFGYRPCALLQTSRGCHSKCHFCLRWLIEGGDEQDEPLDSILDQIERIEEPSIMIFDNDFLHDPERLRSFCDRLEARQIRKNFICYASVKSILAAGDQVARFARLGLVALLVGYEFPRQEELDAFRKPIRVEDSLAASELLRRSGVDCWASVILHPDWGREEFGILRRFLQQVRPQVTSPVPLTPFPGSVIAREFEERLLFPPEEFEKWSFSQVVIRPSKLSLRAYYWEVLKLHYFINFRLNEPGWLYRRFGAATFLRIGIGSFRFGWRYVELMLKG